MFAQFTSWLADLVKGWFAAAWEFVVDAAINLCSLLLTAFASLISAIPVPEFMSQGLSSLWAALPSGVIFIATAVGVPQALALVASGFAFRLLRKVVTLFQW